MILYQLHNLGANQTVSKNSYYFKIHLLTFEWQIYKRELYMHKLGLNQNDNKCQAYCGWWLMEL